MIAQSYCHVDDESFSAFLDLRLRFTNISDHAVILSRRIESPVIVRAARDAQAGKDGDFLYSPDAHFYVAELPNSPSFGDVPDSNLFVILAAGKSFETIVHSGVLGAKGGANDTTVHGLLSKGSYVLQVGVSTWPYRWPYFNREEDVHELRKRWIRYGELSNELVFSDFAPFTLPEHFKNPRCH